MKRLTLTASVLSLLLIPGCAQKSLNADGMPQSNVQTAADAPAEGNLDKQALAEEIAKKEEITATEKKATKAKAKRKISSRVKKEVQVDLNKLDMPAAPITASTPIENETIPAPEQTTVEVTEQEAGASIPWGWALGIAGFGAFYWFVVGRRRKDESRS